MKFPKERAYQAVVATSLKSKKLEVGTELTLLNIVQGSIKNGNRDVVNDVLIMSDNTGKRLRVPMRELVKMRTPDNKELFSNIEGTEDVNIAERLKIVSSTDRKDQSGAVIYPLQAYKLQDDFLNNKIQGWNNLVAGGLKDNHGFEPVQDYIVAAL